MEDRLRWRQHLDGKRGQQQRHQVAGQRRRKPWHLFRGHWSNGNSIRWSKHLGASRRQRFKTVVLFLTLIQNLIYIEPESMINAEGQRQAPSCLFFSAISNYSLPKLSY